MLLRSVEKALSVCVSVEKKERDCNFAYETRKHILGVEICLYERIMRQTYFSLNL